MGDTGIRPMSNRATTIKHPVKLCWFCKHCSFDLGEPAYSNLTPGSPAHLSCGKRHFSYNGSRYAPDTLPKDIVSYGINCPDFK